MTVRLLDRKGCPGKQEKCCACYASNVDPACGIRDRIKIVRVQPIGLWTGQTAMYSSQRLAHSAGYNYKINTLNICGLHKVEILDLQPVAFEYSSSSKNGEGQRPLPALIDKSMPDKMERNLLDVDRGREYRAVQGRSSGCFARQIRDQQQH